MSSLNFFGTMGRKTPVETSPARHWVPAWRKASWSDEPPSKRCVSVTSMAGIFPLFLLETGSVNGINNRLSSYGLYLKLACRY
jgi:hypothetical protein